MNKSKWILDFLFKRHLFATNVLTSGGLMALGDITVQLIERYEGKTTQHNWARTGRLTIFGLLTGPINHVWYSFLDRMLPGTSLLTVFKKITAEQFIAAPIFVYTFLMGTTLLEGKSLAYGNQEVKDKFWTLYKADWCLWPAAQLINFSFVPPQYRVLYVCMIIYVWDSYLAYTKHKTPESKQWQETALLKDS